MYSRKILKILIFFLLVGISVSFLIILFLFYFLFKSSPSTTDKESQIYQYQEIQPYSDHTKQGFVQLNRKSRLNIDEFISYTLPTGGTSIISNFGQNSYQCTGTCVCSSTDKRRTSTLLNRGLSIVLTALTTSLAIKMAEKAFLDQCIQHQRETPGMSVIDLCDEDDMIAEIAKCEGIPGSKFRNLEVRIEVDYICRGHCLQKKGPTEEYDWAQEDYEKWMLGSGPCEKLMKTGVQTVRYYERMNVPKSYDRETVSLEQYRKKDEGTDPLSLQKIHSDMYKRACEEFVQLDLDYFCRWCSHHQLFDYYYEIEMDDNWCTGKEGLGYHYTGFREYKHVHCVLEESDSIFNALNSYNVPFE